MLVELFIGANNLANKHKKKPEPASVQNINILKPVELFLLLPL